VLFYKGVLAVLPPKCRPVDVLRGRLALWKEGRFLELWAAACKKAAFPSRSAEAPVPTRRVLALVEEGQLSAAIRTLNSDPPAPVTEHTFAQMLEKHPEGPTPLCPDVRSEPHTVEVGAVVSAVRLFSNTSAGGLSGLRPAHLRLLLGAVGLVDVQHRLAAVVNRLLSGTLPAVARRYVCGANLTALVKKDKSLRPIACGDVWRRLAARCVCRDFGGRFSEVLAPFQFGVSLQEGREALVHAARVLYEQASSSSDFVVLKFDFQNAFNCVRRQSFLDEVAARFPSLLPFVSLCYGAPSVLQFGDRQLESTSGVQQGEG
jgi:hypothetical protein